MQKARSKVVPVSGRDFELRRLPSDMGSYILMRMLGVSMRMAAASMDDTKPKKELSEEEKERIEKTTGEMRVRAIAFGVLSGGASFEEFKLIQNSCLKVTSVIEERSGVPFPLPVMNDDGVWSADGEEVSSDPGLLMKLTIEVLVFCFADFFDGGGLGLQT